MKTFKIPVTWEVYATVEIEADSIEEAIEIAKDENGLIPCPTDQEYVEGSWRLTDEEPETILELYN